jgi:hypothetical protein
MDSGLPLVSGYEGFPAFIFDPTNPDGGYSITTNTARLPFQYELDVSVFYELEDWMFKVALFNVTDEENWDVNNSGYGNGSILARMPFHAELTIRKRF